MVPAHVVVDIGRTDLERAARDGEMSGPNLERNGGRSLPRGGPISILEGDWEPPGLVMIGSESAQAARDRYDLEDYRGACATREGAGMWRMVAVDGV